MFTIEDTDTDTDTDTGDVEPEPTGACNDALTFGDPAEAVGTYTVGDFMVQLDSSGELFALHQEDLSHSVFHSAPGSWLVVGDNELHAKEHQGSFDIDIKPVYACEQARFTELRTADGVLQFQVYLTTRMPAVQTPPLRSPCARRVRDDCHLAELGVIGDVELQSSSGAVSPTSAFMGWVSSLPDTLNLRDEVAVLSEEGGVGRGHPIIATAVDVVSPGSAGNEHDLLRSTSLPHQ